MFPSDSLHGTLAVDDSTLYAMHLQALEEDAEVESSSYYAAAIAFTVAPRAATWTRYLAAPILRGHEDATGAREVRPLAMDAYWRGSIRNRARVLDAIRKTPRINGLLIGAQDRLSALFPESPLILEGDLDGQQVYVVVQTSLDVDAARDVLDDFDRSWWLESMGPANGNMSVVLEFIT